MEWFDVISEADGFIDEVNSKAKKCAHPDPTAGE